ncbi:MAG TPA: MG2 domain-containing protein, partial [Pirellulaceae bacterium]|nr:MG2 domain-containing protein [Pirellulaceae bacterium]
RLLDAYLTRYAYSPGGKQLSAELHAIAQRAEARAFGGRGLSEKQELAVSLLRTIFNTAPESPAGLHAWDRFTTSHRFPQFLRPQVEVRWQPETDLLAPNGARPRVELKSTLWRFRSEKAEREWQNDNFRYGEPLELRLAPRGLNLEDLVQVNQPVNWELNAKTRESWRAAYEPRWKATVKLESGGWYYLLQELDGFKFFQPLRVVSFRLVTRMISGTGRPGIVMAIDPWTGEGVKGVQLRLTGTESRRVEEDDGAERPKQLPSDQPPSKPKVDEREARQVWIDLGVTDERGICSVQLPFERHLSEMEIEGRRGDERWRWELTNTFMQEDDSPRPEDAHKIKFDELDRERTVLITTDRPLYRPGQEVRYKAVMRDGAGRLVAQPEQPVKVEIRDIGGRLYHSAEHRWNEFGSLSGKWTLADEPYLGEYTISVAVRRPLDDDGGGLGGPRAFFRGGGGIFELEEPWHAYWSETFAVAAYRKPEFEVLIAGGKQPGTAEISAEYFVGGKLIDADVEWKVMLVDKIGADSAGGDWGVKTYEALAPLDDPRAWFYHGRIADEERAANLWNERVSGDLPYLRYARAKVGKPLAEGKGRTDANGKLAINWKATPAEQSVGKKVTIHATVRDASRLAVDGSLDLTGPKPRLKLEVGTE